MNVVLINQHGSGYAMFVTIIICNLFSMKKLDKANVVLLILLPCVA